jgi:single-strand DNA-binding protein
MKNIVIAGNCTKDAEMRTTQNGTNVAGFTVAVNGFANGEKTTDFFDVSLWGKRGEAVMQFAKKGAKICVTGELGTREYNGKTYLTVRASDFTPMGGGSSDDRPQRQEPQRYVGDLDQDEVPF